MILDVTMDKNLKIEYTNTRGVVMTETEKSGPFEPDLVDTSGGKW